MTTEANLIVVFVSAVHLPICAFAAVIGEMVSFQAGIVFFQVVQTLAEASAVVTQLTEETIWDGTCPEI